MNDYRCVKIRCVMYFYNYRHVVATPSKCIETNLAHSSHIDTLVKEFSGITWLENCRTVKGQVYVYKQILFESRKNPEFLCLPQIPSLPQISCNKMIC